MTRCQSSISHLKTPHTPPPERASVRRRRQQYNSTISIRYISFDIPPLVHLCLSLSLGLAASSRLHCKPTQDFASPGGIKANIRIISFHFHRSVHRLGFRHSLYKMASSGHRRSRIGKTRRKKTPDDIGAATTTPGAQVVFFGFLSSCVPSLQYYPGWILYALARMAVHLPAPPLPQ